MLIFFLWPRLGLPPRGLPLDAPFPGSWRWFFAVWLPAMFPAFTLFHERLFRWTDGRERPARAARRARAWDRASYALLPLFLLLMAAWRPIGAWRLPLAAFFVSVLFAKVLGVIIVAYQAWVTGSESGSAVEDPAATVGGETGPVEAERVTRHDGDARRAGDTYVDPLPAGACLFWIAFLLYAFLAAYVVTALSTTGDEHVYLLNTQSLYADRDLEIQNNVAQRDYARFYWGRASPEIWTHTFVGFPALLLPGYALGSALLPGYPLAGRFGATLTIGLCAALLGVQLYRLCRDLGASPVAAFWGWVVIALTPPVLVNSGHVYPELPAALAAVVGARAVLRLPRAGGPALALVTASAVALVGLKDRYVPLSLGLLVWAVARLARGRRALALGTLAGVVVTGVVVLAFNPLPRVFQNLGGAARLWAVLRNWNGWMPQAGLGLLADQEFGLLYYGPHWALAGPGLVLLWRRRREAVIGLVGVTLFYLVVLVKWRWLQWDAGWTPPPRFVVCVTPLLVPLIVEVFDAGRGRVLAVVNTLCLLWSGALAFVLALVPFWRYNNLDGRTTLLQLAGGAVGLDYARFLPSLRFPTEWTWAVLAAGGVLLLAACWYWAGRPRWRVEGWGVGTVVLAPSPAVAVTAAVVLAWTVLAATVPTWAVDGVAMRHSAGIQFGSFQHQEVVWVMTRPGEVSERIVTWPGVTEITIRAAGYTTIRGTPRMRLLLDDTEIHVWQLAADRQWLAREYTARVPTGFARPTLRIEFTDLLDRRDAQQVQHAWVGRIRLKRLPAGTPVGVLAGADPGPSHADETESEPRPWGPGVVLNRPRGPRALVYLAPGAYRARFTLRGGAGSAGQESAVLRVFAERRLLATRSVSADELDAGRRVADVPVPFVHDRPPTAMAIQVEATGHGSFAVDRMRIEPDLPGTFRERWWALQALGG
jgi:hypothetical protein